MVFDSLPVCILSHLSHVRFFAIPWTIAPQAPWSMGISRQEYWSWLSCPPPGHLCDLGIKPCLLCLRTAGDSLTSEPPWKPFDYLHVLSHSWFLPSCTLSFLINTFINCIRSQIQNSTYGPFTTKVVNTLPTLFFFLILFLLYFTLQYCIGFAIHWHESTTGVYELPILNHIYTMEYYSAIKKNTFESVLMRWMKLEPIIQSEVSQKEKHQYSILTHIYGI